MRNLELPGRSVSIARNGMAATSHVLSTLAAVNVLQAGGNAMDAAVAACAVQCVVEPGSTGIGGDCFALYAPRGAENILAFNGSGRAPGAASVASYREMSGGAVIPRQSPMAVTVPGAVDAWEQLVRDHGTMSLSDILQPAIRLAEDGYAITERVHVDWEEQTDLLKAEPTAREIFLSNGAAPAVGSIHRQPKLADTLRRIAAEGARGFYAGDVARDIVDYLQGLGGVHTLQDFAEAKGDYVSPIHTRYRDCNVYECPPNGQGIVALLILNILARYEGKGSPMSLERHNRIIEATRIAYSVRDSVLADPSLSKVNVEHLLSEAFAAELQSRIKEDKPIEVLGPVHVPEHKDTVYITVVDKDRNAASFINSVFATFGSGLVSPKSGVLLHNRGTSFVLDESHPNALMPRKRPMHTIIPGMAARDGHVTMSFGVMGGHYQAMGQAWFLSNVLDYGLDLQEAMSLPRIFPLPGTTTIEAEATLPADIASALTARGYELRTPSRPIGGSQAVAIDWDKGVLLGASDHRKDGCALGY
jgi:gamma-glutamyltranspeptidase/glutathione hydrolase